MTNLDLLDDEGKAKAAEILAVFAARKQTPNHDLILAYVTSYQRWIKAERWLADPNHSTVVTIRDDKGVIKSHGPAPQLKIAETSCKEMSRIGKILRLNR